MYCHLNNVKLLSGTEFTDLSDFSTTSIAFVLLGSNGRLVFLFAHPPIHRHNPAVMYMYLSMTPYDTSVTLSYLPPSL